MNAKEVNIYRTRYSYCNNAQEREDLIFLYPSEFDKDPNVIANLLQQAIVFLKRITGLDPASFFGYRTVVGHRHPNDENGKDCQPGSKENWVNIPWNYMEKLNEPLDMCTHELVHPFFRCSPLFNRNEGWGEGFCEFIRGPLKKSVGLDGDNWWQLKIKEAIYKVDSEYCYPAGQLALNAYREFGQAGKTINDLIDDQEAIKAFIKFLFANFENTSLSKYIPPSPTMIKNWQAKNKI